MPVAQQAVDRARWLAEVSAALAQAQRLLRRWITIAGDNEPLIELQVRIEDARSAVGTLQLRHGGREFPDFHRNWIEPSAWQPRG